MRRIFEESSIVKNALKWGAMNPTGRKLEAAQQTKKDEKFEKQVEEELRNHFVNKRSLRK